MSCLEFVVLSARMNPTIGPLLVVISRMIYRDATRFLVVYSVVLLGFSLLMRSSMYGGVSQQFTSDWDSLSGTMLLMWVSVFKPWPLHTVSGGPSYTFRVRRYIPFQVSVFQPWPFVTNDTLNALNPVNATVAYVLCSAMMNILLLNLLIAMLSHSYNDIMAQERSQQEWFSLHAEQILQAERSMVGSCLSWRQLREGVLGYSSGPKPLVRSWTQLIEGHDAAPVRSTGRMGSSVDNAGTWYLEMEIYANASDLGVQPGAAPTDEQMSGMVAQVDSSVFRLERLEEQQARQAVSLERMEALLTRIGDRVGANRQRRAVGAKQERRSHLEA